VKISDPEENMIALEHNTFFKYIRWNPRLIAFFFHILHDKCFFLIKDINERAINESEMQFNSNTARIL
jgi:hypothetical protein